MNAPLLWFGPVSTAHIKASVPERYELTVLGCTGDASDGKPRCSEHADAWLEPNGWRIPRMRTRLRVGLGLPVLAAFSAGGQIVKRLLANHDDQAEVAAVYLADATYTTDWRERGRVAGVDAITYAFVDYALRALEDGRWFVATASTSPNKDYPSGVQTLDAIRREVEKRSGRSFEDARNDPLLAGLKSPLGAWRLRNVLFVHWDMKVYKHGEHPTVVAPVLLPRVLAEQDAPTPATSPRSASSSSSPAAMPAPPATTAPSRARWFGAGVVVAIIAAVVLWARRLVGAE